LSENASSFGAISRLNHASSRWPGMLARPAAIAVVPLADGRASRAVHRGAAPRIVARGSLRCGRFASHFDRAQAVFTPCFRHACLAMTAPSLQNRLAAQRALDAAESIERVRVIEATAAGFYFSAWRDVRIRFRERDLARIPARSLRADSRASALTGAPRAATSPINAMRNYLFACLESEARLALLAHGLDPTLGVLHADQRNRDSLALDAIEPVRADVDAFLLDLLGGSRVHRSRFWRAPERHLPNRRAAYP
jgi:hypothetical protein